MKTFIIVAVVAVLSIVLVEISQSDARPGRRCNERNQPPMNTSSVTCGEDRRANRRCASMCKFCYDRRELARPFGCVPEGGNCTCLGKPATETPPPEEDPETPPPEEDPETPPPEEDPETPPENPETPPEEDPETPPEEDPETPPEDPETPPEEDPEIPEITPTPE